MLQRYDPTVRGVILMALLVLVEGIQVVIIAGLISSFVPFRMDPFNLDLFPVNKSSLKPNRQMFIYHIFIMASILAQAIGVYAFRGRLKENGFQNNIKRLLCVDAVWVFIQCFAVFKILIYKDPGWGWGLFYISLAASMLSRIFWVELVHWWERSEKFFKMDSRFRGNDKDVTQGQGIQANEYLWTPLLVLAESLQAVIGFNWLWAHIKAENPLLSYGVFIASIGLFSFLVLARKVRAWQTRPFIVVETLITFLLLSAIFKMVVYDYRNQLATNAYHVLLVLAVLNKIFWPVIGNAGKTVYIFLTSQRNTRTLQAAGDCFLICLIVAIFYLPDPQGVLAKMFVGEQFHHITSFIMAPAWAYVSGCVLDVDVISRYGIGLPVVLTTLTKFLGGFNYLNMLLVMMWVCIVYFVLSYIFLRVWLKSFTLAVAAILMGIKVQMFYTLTVPQPLTYASGTPVRFMFDVLFFFSIWGHLCKQKTVYLWAASLSCAGAIFYMMETGLYLTTAFYGYLFMYGLVPSLRRSMFSSLKSRAVVSLCVLSVPLGALLFFGMAVGRHVIDHQFWYNNFEFTKYFTGGLELGPFYGGLQYGQFWDLLIGFLFPIVYVLTILIIGTLCVLDKISRKHLMVLVLCIYGLGADHYYVAMATANNYYMRGLPFVFVIFYWIRLAVIGLRRETRQGIGMALVVFSTYALWTNHHFLSYPNILNFSRNPLVDPLVAEELPGRRPYFFHKVWDYPENLKLPLNSLGQKDEGLTRDFASDEELKAYYVQESHFPKDARLIRSLTAPAQPVALISSFETEILMQADRKPLFYYFRILYSRPMRMRNFPTDEILTTVQLQKLIDQMQGSSSPYVFMERIFLNSDYPKAYAHDDPGLIGLLEYVKDHYQPYAYGEFLVAMKRKGE